jgi:hypothetical protein
VSQAANIFEIRAVLGPLAAIIFETLHQCKQPGPEAANGQAQVFPNGFRASVIGYCTLSYVAV